MNSRSVSRTRWGVAALYGLIGAVLVGVVVAAFVWPAATARPHDLAVGVSGPPEAVSAVESALDEQDPSPFALREVGSREEAVAAIRSREIYGAILLGDEPEVLIATAASTAAAQALRGVATELQTQIQTQVQEAMAAQLAAVGAALAAGTVPQLPGASSGASAPTVTVTDVVPLTDADPTGAGLSAVAFPLVLGGMVGGVLLVLLVAGVVRRLVGLVVFGAAAGAVIVFVMQTWFGLLPGTWAVNALGAGLGVTATAALVIGLNALIGAPGIGVAAAITMLIANPISAAAMPLAFLPAPWGQVGQWFAPGAAATLMRSLGYFPDAVTWPQWLTLSLWVAGGVVLALVGHHRQRADIASAPA